MSTLLIASVVLISVQVLAALPWVFAVAGDRIRPQIRARGLPLVLLGGVALTALLGVGFGLLMNMMGDPDTLKVWGKYYLLLLQLQLSADLIVLVFFLLYKFWSKGAAVARAAFREGYRQPMFWLILSFGVGLMTVTPFLPYFTFGEDYLMVQEIGFDAVILSAMLFGVLAAATSISEEIEGRTAVTLMSKPVSRRQFLLGKFVGIFLAALVMVMVLGTYFQQILLLKQWLEHMEDQVLPLGLQLRIEGEVGNFTLRQFVGGMGIWLMQITEVIPGLVKSSALVMILVAIAVSLATRLPMIVNLVVCLIVYFLANLMPILVQVTEPAGGANASTWEQLVYFVAQLFDSLLPGLELLRVNPTLVGAHGVPLNEYVVHVLSAGLYGLMYTAIVLLIGLVLFEDRDLA